MTPIEERVAMLEAEVAELRLRSERADRELKSLLEALQRRDALQADLEKTVELTRDAFDQRIEEIRNATATGEGMDGETLMLIGDAFTSNTDALKALNSRVGTALFLSGKHTDFIQEMLEAIDYLLDRVGGLEKLLGPVIAGKARLIAQQM
jgi:hypothetical protein